LDDRRKIYNNEITSSNFHKMKKPESWIIIPLYSSGESASRYKRTLKRLRETYNIPFIDVRMSRIVVNKDSQNDEDGESSKIITSVIDEEKDFLLKHDFEATIIELIKEELQEQIDQVEDKVELVSSWIDETYNEDNLFIEGLKSRLEEYEYFTRDPEAREKCLKKWGYTCFICGKDLEDVYGQAGKNKIEVHHLKQICEGYRVTDPENDLIPVCPDCHTIIHTRNPMYDPIEITQMLEIIELIEENK